jgi:hypothetical protein
MAIIPSGTKFHGVSGSVPTQDKKSALLNSYSEAYTLQDFIDSIGGGGLEGTNYLFVAANGTDAENAAELQAAYDKAKTMSPSEANRITIVAAPGKYYITEGFEMDTEYIDLVSLDGNRSIVLNTGYVDFYRFTDYSVVTSFDYFEEIPFDPNTVSSREYTTFKDSLDGQIGLWISGGYLIMHSLATDNYYLINFLSWTGNGEGGGFSYTRQLITAEMDEPIVTFTKTNYGNEVDIIEEGLLEITRGENGPIFNIALEESADNDSPAGTEWNFGATQETIETTDVIQDGGMDMYNDGNALFADDNLVSYTHTQLEDSVPGPSGVPIENFVMDGVVTSGDLIFGTGSSYFTNLYPGLFVMAAQGAQIDEFKVQGVLGAYGSGLKDGYTFQSGSYKVFVKRVWGASYATVNHIIIVNTTSNSVTQTIGASTTSDIHTLNNLLSAGVTEVYHLVTATKEERFISNDTISRIANEFISIINSSSDINALLSNLNVNYENVINTQTPIIGSVIISADNVYVKGLNVGEKGIFIGSNLSNTIIENCIGGRDCFYNDEESADISSAFIDCEGGDYSFSRSQYVGNFLALSGAFTNCKGGYLSFGAYGLLSGIFTNCQGGDLSFGNYGTASGTFTNCVSGNTSFGTSGFASGKFTNCVSGNSSFGSFGTASGEFISCRAGIQSFGGLGTASGTFTDCQGGSTSFGGGNFAQANGVFTNCIGGSDSFGGTLSGDLYYCRLTSGTFETVSGGGRTIYCIDGNNNTNNQ